MNKLFRVVHSWPKLSDQVELDMSKVRSTRDAKDKKFEGEVRYHLG